MRTLILCGGKGTRAYPATAEVPKPLMAVGGVPILHRVMDIYARQGFTDFVLAGGYLVDQLHTFAADLTEPWSVEVVDTGVETNTGGRVAQCADRMGATFFCTYADGLGNVDLHQLLSFHESHPGCATLTTVPLPSQYGTIDVDGQGRVERFREKPRLPDHLINAGFFVFDQRTLDIWPDPGEDLERDVLRSLGDLDELFAFRHLGFWKSMDTFKDAMDLGSLCADGPGPWLDAPGAVPG